jgi:hypothetical protein
MSSNYRLRLAAAGAMFLCLICFLLQGRRVMPVLLVGQVLFGGLAFGLVAVLMVGMLRKS